MRSTEHPHRTSHNQLGAKMALQIEAAAQMCASTAQATEMALLPPSYCTIAKEAEARVCGVHIAFYR